MATVTVYNRWDYDNTLTGARTALGRGDYSTAFCNFKACLEYIKDYEPWNDSEISMFESAISNVETMLTY